MKDIKQSIKLWYFDNPQREALHHIILRDVRSHEVAFKGFNRVHRGYSFGKKYFLTNQLNERFGNQKSENPLFHMYRSVDYVKIVNPITNKPYSLPDERHIWGWDFIIDIDAEENITLAHQYSKKIFNFYNDLGVPFSISFSGNRGFHLTISWQHLKTNFMPEDYPFMARKLAEFIMNKLQLTEKIEVEEEGKKKQKWIFDINQYKEKQMFRVKYSFHADSGKIALSLTKEEFMNFDISITEPEYIIKNFNLLERDVPIINPNGNCEKLINLFLKENQELYDENKLKLQRETTILEQKKQSILEQINQLPEPHRKEILERLG